MRTFDPPRLRTFDPPRLRTFDPPRRYATPRADRQHALVCSRYVPHHSARVQLCDEAVHDPHYGAVFVSMVHQLLEPLGRAGVNLSHVEVHFGDSGSTALMAKLDEAIGRTAHINFLDNNTFVRMFVHAYLHYFV